MKLPLHVVKRRDPAHLTEIHDANNCILMLVRPCSTPDAEAAVAQGICDIVNAHQQLVEACQSVDEIATLDYKPNASTRIYTIDGVALDAARAALALVRGEGEG